MNITLSADENLILKTREYAKAHHTTLNQLIRDYMSKVSGSCDTEKAAAEFTMLAKSMSGKSDEDFKFSRSELYDRNSLR